MKKIVIVGAVGGGATVAGQIRFYDKEARITVFDRDSTMSYAACGTPYVIGDVIEDETSLIMASPEQFKEKRNITVHMKHEAIEIKRNEKKLVIQNLETGQQFEEAYDFLILSPGGTAVLPETEGLSTTDYFTLRNYEDMQRIKDYITSSKPASCAISGGGFIGLEMAENLRHLGIEVQLVHKSPYIMSILDPDIAEEIEDELKANKVHLHTGSSITKVDHRRLTLSNGQELEADFLLFSIGIKPNTELAERAGLSIGDTGGIVTNEFMQTSDSSIYAIGDASENLDFVTGEPRKVPLASPAHRQAFLVARHITGHAEKKTGLLGTSVVKIFSLTAAMTGLNERTLKDKEMDYETVVHRGNSNAGYYPDHAELTLKVHYDIHSRKILGAQCIGRKGIDKRIDVIVTAMYGGLTIDDLQALELCYAPPYSSPKDPVNMVGYKAVKN
ncbi:CoA-disulfide reductase [Planococcus salinus]|uniref:CoA-disulfide reductase n=1 Tax=Planococcus salinus TaxID=1848460 RepID=A0A3M8P431_9BACL|nr:CoA-disulfide reductase [Planococcus salinus]RNF38140.1 CoA-disulfide reductase [Planococcus salinus]